MSRITIGERRHETISDNALVFEVDQSTVTFSIEELKASWSAWNNLESVIRKLDTPLTPEEWSVLEGIATTPAAKNGLAELKQAVSQRGGVGVFSDRKSLKPEIQ